MLELCIQRGCNGILHFAETAVIRIENLFAEQNVAAFQQGDERGVRKLVYGAVAVRNVREAEICVSQRAADIIRSIRHFTRGSQKCFALLRKDMRGASAYQISGPAIRFQRGAFFIKCLDLLFRDRHDLGIGKGCGAEH